ncbi:hypothetical protein BDZ91DRAFT_728315 [Kalaharituber pfeilii]|nr:hypothetical protein BDZ91DRAFT_728315 [Kalaharituber pfeilii]
MESSTDDKEVGIIEINDNSENLHGTKSMSNPEERPKDPSRKKQKKQNKRWYKDVITRVLMSVVLALGLLGLFKGYESKGALTRNEKYTFNTVNLFISTLMGLNMTITYTHTVNLIRGGIKNKFLRKESNQENRVPPDQRRMNEKKHWTMLPTFDELGEFPHYGTIQFLFEVWSPQPAEEETSSNVQDLIDGTVTSGFLTLIWVIFNLGLTIAISLLGLTYSLEEGGAIGRSPGSVFVANTSRCFQKDADIQAEQGDYSDGYACKAFAEVSFYNISAPYHGESGDLEYGYKKKIRNGWQYFFREASVKDPTLVVSSNRSVTTGAICTARELTAINNNAGDGYSHFVYYDDDGKTFNLATDIYIPRATNYFAPVDPDVSSQCESGNPRCSPLLVLELGSPMHYLYNCSSWVDQMSPSIPHIYDIPERIARVAATSLAQSGMPAAIKLWSGDNSTSPLPTNWVFFYYATGFGWGMQAKGNAEKMAEMISEASAGVFAMMDQVNPRYTASGSEPWRGVGLEVKWKRVIPLLVIVGIVQAIAALPSILWHMKYSRPSQLASPATKEDQGEKV